jgi:predicted enzyme related to lactoylglutathione lyase
MKLKAKLIHISVPAFQKERQHQFYGKLFGIDLARSLTDTVEAHHIPISADGIYLTVAAPQSKRDNHMTCFFAVADLNQTIAELKDCGGKVLVAPFDIPVAERAQKFYSSRLDAVKATAPAPEGEFARVAYVEDPDGNLLGLMEIHQSAHVFFGLGENLNELTQDQATGHEVTLEAGKRFHQDKKATL